MGKFLLKSILSLIFFIKLSSVEAQNNWAIGGMYYPGFLYGHTADAKNLESHINGFEVSVSRINNIDKGWNRFYKHAQISYNLIYMDLGRPQITGYAYSVGANFQFQIAEHKNNHLSVRLGTGIAYLTQAFDFYKNRQNVAIGSNWNGRIHMAFIYNTTISSRLTLNTGIGGTHFSNGSLRAPNLGINMPSLFIGLQMGFGSKKRTLSDTIKAYKTTNKKHEILLNYAFKEKFISNPREFNIFSLGYRWLKPITPVRRWYLGGDLVWDPTHPYSHDLKNNNPRVGIDNSTELAALIGHRYDIGKFSMITDIGFYIINPYQTKYFSYQRVGFRYELNKDWFLNGALKIHFGTADYFEWGIGYKFYGKRK